MWLALANKILTWDNGLNRGWKGWNRYVLFKLEGESTDHIFIQCSSTKVVWKEILQTLNCLGTNLPYYVMWGLWLHRNRAIF
jgi:hypothetical protein